MAISPPWLTSTPPSVAAGSSKPSTGRVRGIGRGIFPFLPQPSGAPSDDRSHLKSVNLLPGALAARGMTLTHLPVLSNHGARLLRHHQPTEAVSTAEGCRPHLGLTPRGTDRAGQTSEGGSTVVPPCWPAPRSSRPCMCCSCKARNGPAYALGE